MTSSTRELADLGGTVALVAGGSRGAGRAIATELGRAGARVIVTGRTTRNHQPPVYERVLRAAGLASMPGSIDETCDDIEAAGGEAAAMVCDHSDDTAVRELIEAIEGGFGRLDVLVSNVWGGHEAFHADAGGRPLWDQPLDQWDAMFDHGVRNQLVTLRHAAPLMVRTGGRLIVAPTFWDRGQYLEGSGIYDLAKAAINRLSFAAAGSCFWSTVTPRDGNSCPTRESTTR
jgi:NAD(P)-dependent dehydrogenase (short-subunit alcohol dehydrogenase family)